MAVDKKLTTQKKDEKENKRRRVKPQRVKKAASQQNHPRQKISKIQDLQLQVIAHTTHNNCDGRKLDRLLRKNRHLWRAVMMPNKQLYPLRDMEEGLWSADTLYILVKEGNESELEDLAREQFNADEINWIGSDQTLEMLGYWKKDEVRNPKLIMSIWWD